MDMLSTPSLGSMNLVKHIAKGDSNEKKGVNYLEYQGIHVCNYCNGHISVVNRNVYIFFNIQLQI